MAPEKAPTDLELRMGEQLFQIGNRRRLHQVDVKTGFMRLLAMFFCPKPVIATINGIQEGWVAPQAAGDS